MDEKKPNKPPLDKEIWRDKFLKSMQKTGNITYSAKVAGVNRLTAKNHMRKDEEFGRACMEAKEAFIESLEKEAHRRAVRGVTKPVYQGGELVGEITEYSDTLLIFMLKALAPEKYRERYDQKVTMDQEIKVKLDGVYDNGTKN